MDKFINEKIKEGLTLFIKSEELLGDKIVSGSIIKVGSKTFILKPKFYKVKLPVGSSVEIYFIEGTNKFYFNSEVVPVKLEDVLRFFMPEKIHRSKIREFARVPVSLKAIVKQRNSSKTFEAEIINLSGNGMTIKTNGSFTEDKELLIEFYNKDLAKKFTIVAQVVRCEILFTKDEIYKYQIALTYNTLKPQDHKDLLIYIHTQQIKMV